MLGRRRQRWRRDGGAGRGGDAGRIAPDVHSGGRSASGVNVCPAVVRSSAGGPSISIGPCVCRAFVRVSDWLAGCSAGWLAESNVRLVGSVWRSTHGFWLVQALADVFVKDEWSPQVAVQKMEYQLEKHNAIVRSAMQAGVDRLVQHWIQGQDELQKVSRPSSRCARLQPTAADTSDR